MIITYTDSARHGECAECGKRFIRRAIDAADDGKLCRDCYLKQKQKRKEPDETELLAMSDETTLLPCPFCGGEAEFRIFDTICNVECSECFNGTRYYALDDYEQAVAAWNARAERTCSIEDRYYDELWEEVCTRLSCGHDVWRDPPKFCSECGARVIE